jgi:hypothetical protein
MRTGPEDVRSPGSTGSHRRTFGMTRMTGSDMTRKAAARRGFTCGRLTKKFEKSLTSDQVKIAVGRICT